jgi:hypothetical protein
MFNFLGLENSKIFSILMIIGVLSLSGLLAVICYLRGSIEILMRDNIFPKGFSGVRLISSNYVFELAVNAHSFLLVSFLLYSQIDFIGRRIAGHMFSE